MLADPGAMVGAQAQQDEAAHGQATETDAAAAPGTAVLPAEAHRTQAAPERRKLREAESAYLAGAKKLELDELDAAENEFKRALLLDPENRDYAIAISVTRQHRLAALVQQASKARQAGESARAEKLLADARALDPDNPIVTEHSGLGSIDRVGVAQGQKAESGAESAAGAQDATRGPMAAPLADRATMVLGDMAREPWRIEAPVLTGSIQLTPDPEAKGFHLRGSSQEVLNELTAGFGIHAIFDESVPPKEVRFDIEEMHYEQAMAILCRMTQTFAVALDPTTVLLVKDDTEHRERLQRQLEETIYLPTSTTEEINNLSTLMKNIFDIKQATVQTGSNSIVVRAPQELLGPVNRTLQGLIEASGEVMIEVKMYEVDTTRMTNVGATIPTTAGIYNVEQAAAQLVNANQSLVQEAIAQGFISSTASNIDVALALIGSGLVQSPMLSATIGFFGKGLTETGITASTNTAFNLGLNSSDLRQLDDVQLRVGDRQPAIFREGSRYPVTTSTYTSGISAAASALGNASINGVSVASLLSQYSGGTSITIPQVSYEDLGVTLNATPTVQKSGRINMALNLKIQALGGGSANGIPVLESRQFASDITVADGESALMVSNVTRSETAAMSGIPGLSELPGFQLPISENTEKDTSQLVVVVTPHVVRRRSDLFAGPRMSLPASLASQASADSR